MVMWYLNLDLMGHCPAGSLTIPIQEICLLPGLGVFGYF